MAQAEIVGYDLTLNRTVEPLIRTPLIKMKDTYKIIAVYTA